MAGIWDRKRLKNIINLWFFLMWTTSSSNLLILPLFVASAVVCVILSILSPGLHSFVSLLCFAYWKLFSPFFALYSQWLNIMELFGISLRLLLCEKVFFIFCESFDSCRPVQIIFCFIHSLYDVERTTYPARSENEMLIMNFFTLCIVSWKNPQTHTIWTKALII